MSLAIQCWPAPAAPDYVCGKVNEAHNGNGRSTGRVLATVPEKLIKALPAGFTVLIVLNILFMGALTWAVQHNSEARNALLTKIIDNCLQAR
jgi:hypothetical protein